MESGQCSLLHSLALLVEKSRPLTSQFENQLRALNIHHVYTVMPGTHSMFVWRPALSNFLQEIFKH